MLNRQATIVIDLYVWQLIALIWVVLLLAYAAWEVYWYAQVGTAAFKWHTFAIPAISIGAALLLPIKACSYLRQNLLAGYIYVVLCICVWQEFHPFTRMPMYDTFATHHFSFKVTDSQCRLIATQYNLNMHSGALSHLFSTICRIQKTSFTPAQMQDNRLQLIGKEMMDKIKLKNTHTLNTDTLHLYMVCDYYSNNQMLMAEVKMASKALADITRQD